MKIHFSRRFYVIYQQANFLFVLIHFYCPASDTASAANGLGALRQIYRFGTVNVNVVDPSRENRGNIDQNYAFNFKLKLKHEFLDEIHSYF